MFQSRPEVGDLLPVGGRGAKKWWLFFSDLLKEKPWKHVKIPKPWAVKWSSSIFSMIVTELMWWLASDVRDDGHFFRTCWLTAQLGPGFWRIYPQSWMTKGDLMWHCEIGWQDISIYQSWEFQPTNWRVSARSWAMDPSTWKISVWWPQSWDVHWVSG